jgi:hypothetical protein
LPLQPNLAAVDLNILGEFFNAVQNDPSIGDYVHTVQFTHAWHAEAAEASLPLQSGSRQLKLKDVPWIKQGAVQNLLASLPKLDRVVLEIIGYGNPSALEVDFVFLLHKMLQNCTAPITIKSIQPFGLILTQIAALPNVDTLVVSDNTAGDGNWDPLVAANAVSWVLEPPGHGIYHNIRHLDLGCGVPLITWHFVEIATMFPQLLHLRAHSRVSDSMLPKLLLGLKDTLQTLDIWPEQCCVFTPHSGPPADFSSFTTLKALRVPSTTFIQGLACFDSHLYDHGYIWSLQDDGRNKIPALLPPQLEELDLLFSWPNALFTRGGEYHSQFKTLPQDIQSKGFTWVEDLLETGVKRVGLKEFGHTCLVGAKNVQIDTPSVLLEIPDVVKEKLDAHGVALQVWLLD